MRVKLKCAGDHNRIKAAGKAFYAKSGIFRRMNLCGYGPDQTIRAVDVQKILRPQLSGKDKSGLQGLKDWRVFLVLRFVMTQTPIENDFIYLNSMEMVRLFFLLLAAASLIFLVIGLFRPWAMLWWEDVQNRRKVIKVYGTATLLCYAIYWILYFFAGT